MSISAPDLALLLLITRSKSISRAARQTGVEQSTLSRQLSSLEDRLGRRLFTRYRYGLEPSSFVNELLPWAEKVERMVQMANHAGEEKKSEVEGEVHVSCVSSIADRMLAIHAPDFLAQHPHLSLRVTSARDSGDIDQLQFDVAIKIGERPKGDVVSVKIMESPLKFFCSPHVSISMSQVRIEDLKIVCHEREIEFLLKRFPQLKKNQFRLSSDRLATCLKAAEEGAGAVLIPEVFGTYLKTLSPLDVKGWSNPHLKIFLAAPRVARNLPRVEVTWDWIISLFRVA